MHAEHRAPKFALCIRSEGCEDLEIRKVYRVLPDAQAEKEGYMRIVDESGEDYLYPAPYFVVIRLPRKAQSVVAAKA